MRVDLKKYLFVGLQRERSNFFKKAQEVGVVHFIDPKLTKPTDVPSEIREIASAIKVLRTLPVLEQEELTEYAFADGFSAKILELQNFIEKGLEKQRMLKLELARVAPLGNYSPEKLAWIEKEANRKLQFYSAKEGLQEKQELPEQLIHIRTEYGLDYFMGINKEPTQYEKMIEIKPTASLKELENRYLQAKQEIEEAETKLKQYAKYNEYLHHALIHKLNHSNLKLIGGFAESILDGDLFTIEGWIPKGREYALQYAFKNLHIHIEEIAIDPQDRIPTYLENEGAARIGEDLVQIYDTPSKDDKDPSLWVLSFFALFFAMIVGDAGYGLILLLTALYIGNKAKKITKGGKRALTLVAILGSFTIVWGALTTSFFGISIAPDSPVRKISLMTWLVEKKVAYHFNHEDEVAKEWIHKFPALSGLQNPQQILMQAKRVDEKSGKISYPLLNEFSENMMLEFALLIGVLHITLSFIRYLDRNRAGIGWIVFMVGAYLYFPLFLGTTSMIHFVLGIDKVKGAHNGLILMYGGIGLAVFLAIIKNKFLGILEAMNVIQVFADVMSYLRLYALGLAGMLVTGAMTDLAGGLNVVFGALLLIVSHLVNISLAIMGGVIHGLRLNFLEWYHYSFEGDGKRFSPLKKLEIE